MVNLRNLIKILPKTHAPLLTAAEKAHCLMGALSALTLNVIVENRAIFTSVERSDFLREWATNLKHDWVPEGLTASDMEQVPLDWMIGMAFALASGNGLGGYEQQLFERFSHPLDLSELPEPEHGARVKVTRRTYLRR